MRQETNVKRHRQDFTNEEGVVVPTETENGIYGLFGKYRGLSNFHLEPVTVNNITYKCSEGAYMAEKTDVMTEKLYLAMCGGKDAKNYGQKVTLRPDWEEVKVEAMENILMCKFSQSDSLRALLFSTGDKYIEETNWWGDKFWGVCAGEGRNELGKCLMRVRDRLKKLDF